ncbi:MAG: LptF/LptG family permease [bacterium]
MRILDVYILKRFVTILLFALISSLLIVIVVDLVGNLDKFIDKKVPFLVVVKYYVFYMPYWLLLILPIAMLLSSLFSVGHLARNNELIAMKSVSIPLSRILRPLLMLGLVISLVALAFGEKVVPLASQGKSNIEKKYIEVTVQHLRTRVTNIYWRDKLDRRIFIGYYDSFTKTANKVSIQKYLGDEIVERIDAPKMIWKDGTWVLYNGYKRSFDGNHEKAEPFRTFPETQIDFKPQQLAQTQVEPEDMSFEELKHFIAEVTKNGGNPTRWLVDLNLKLSIPFANFIMVLFGAPLASNKKRSGAIMGIFISLLICFLYFGMVKLTQTTGQNGTLSPLLAAWLSNGVFFVGGLCLLAVARK